MYLECYLIDTGVYKVEMYSINHHLLYECIVYADSFEDAELKAKRRVTNER